MRPPAALLGACLLALAAPAVAQDARIRDLVYAPDVVHRIDGAFRTATQIIFSPDETIRHAAVGDSVAWEVAAEGSVLFLKPRERHAPTNLLVVTERAGGELRHYAFALDARATAAAVHQVRFHYPADERAVAEAALAEAARTAENRLIGLELSQGAIEGPRNFAWSAQGDAALQPSEVSDNGRFTVLRFPGSQAVPAIFETDGGTERLVPYDVRGEFVVIHSVVRGLRLRRGRAVLCLFNEAFDDRAGATGTGTASPRVERVRKRGGS